MHIHCDIRPVGGWTDLSCSVVADPPVRVKLQSGSRSRARMHARAGRSAGLQAILHATVQPPEPMM